MVQILFDKMALKKNIAINVVLNSLIFYVIGRTLRDHQTGLRLGLIGGILSGTTVWYVDTQTEGAHT